MNFLYINPNFYPTSQQFSFSASIITRFIKKNKNFIVMYILCLVYILVWMLKIAMEFIYDW